MYNNTNYIPIQYIYKKGLNSGQVILSYKFINKYILFIILRFNSSAYMYIFHPVAAKVKFKIYKSKF